MFLLAKYVALTVLVLGFANGAVAAVRAVECHGCSPLQEEQKALGLSGRGYLFVYNITNNRIRKFEVVLMADGRAAATAPATKPRGTLVATDNGAAVGDASAQAGGSAVRELWEYAVDAGVQRIFDTIVQAEAQIPGVLTRNRTVEVPIRNIGLVPGPIGPRPHDPRDIAWWSGAPQGSAYNDFMDRLHDQLDDRASAERINATVARVLFDFHGQTRGVGVDVGLDSLSAGVSWERISPLLTIKLCDDAGNCVKVTVKRENGTTQATYEGVVDPYNLTLPTKEQARGMELGWRANGREGANAYATWLRGRGHATVEYVGGQQAGCGGYILACVRIEGSTMLACQLHCQ